MPAATLTGSVRSGLNSQSIGVVTSVALSEDADEDLALLHELREHQHQPAGKSHRVVSAFLTPGLLEYIETKRAGHDLNLTLRIFASVVEVEPTADTPDMLWTNGSRLQPLSMGEATATISLNSPRSIWVDRVIPRLGYQSTRLIQVSVPMAGSLAPEFEKAVAELAKAEAAFPRDDYANAVVGARWRSWERRSG